jgi:hypothetical protein
MLNSADRRDVADVVGDRAHHDGAGDAVGQRRVALDRPGDVGERSERDQGQLAGVVV